MKELAKSFPPGLEYTMIYDTTRFARESNVLANANPPKELLFARDDRSEMIVFRQLPSLSQINLPRMTTTYFLGFLLLMTMVVVTLCARYRDARTAAGVLAGLCAWFLYVGVLGYRGVVANSAMRPPGVTLIVVPVMVFLVFFVLRTGARLALAFPIRVLIGTQVFRVGVELLIHQLWLDGLVPKMLTFAGANVDIYVGATAPLMAWLSARGGWWVKLALGWNVLGLLALANVVIRAVLTSPGPLNLIHTEVPNRMIGTFPFMFIPGFFVPLAVVLHVLAIRRISGR